MYVCTVNFINPIYVHVLPLLLYITMPRTAINENPFPCMNVIISNIKWREAQVILRGIQIPSVEYSTSQSSQCPHCVVKWFI